MSTATAKGTYVQSRLRMETHALSPNMSNQLLVNGQHASVDCKTRLVYIVETGDSFCGLRLKNKHLPPIVYFETTTNSWISYKGTCR